jgi:hypothetical protein
VARTHTTEPPLTRGSRERFLLTPLFTLAPPIPGLPARAGNAILREIDVAHPAAKSMLELARSQARVPLAAARSAWVTGARHAVCPHASLTHTMPPTRPPSPLRRRHRHRPPQDEEVGDGTTSVIILAGELLSVSEPFLARDMHPTVIVNAYHKALEFALATMEKLSVSVNVADKSAVRDLIRSCVGTKFTSRYGDVISDLALEAVLRVTVEEEGGRKEIDIKRYAKVEKLPGGELDECRVLDGVMVRGGGAKDESGGGRGVGAACGWDACLAWSLAAASLPALRSLALLFSVAG